MIREADKKEPLRVSQNERVSGFEDESGIAIYYFVMGKDILWRCVSVDDSGTLMLADSIIDTLPYDAITSDNSRSKSHSRDYRRDTYGSNYWKDSNMRSWLNSMAEVGGVKWLCGNPPKENYVDGNAYDQKAGFLNNFSRAEIATMRTVTQRSLVSHPEYKRGIMMEMVVRI